MNVSFDKPISIVILDSHALVRAGLRLIVDSYPGMKVVGEAGEANEGLEIVASQNPDIILLKLDPVGNFGLEIIRELLKVSRYSRIAIPSSAWF